ncbi:MAG TPA: hemerythrin domain-containing protein [Woeseiaceae bacterium]
MTIPTTQLLAELRRDHANVSLLLEILEEQSQRLLAMERPDYDVMDDIMHYMTSFADAVHHPKEDVLYRRLRKLRPELQGRLLLLEQEHAEIGRLGVDLRSDIEAIESEAMVRRETVFNDARAYIGMLRNHMLWEEEELFVLLEELSGAIDDDDDDTAMPQGRDPLFGGEVERDFERLFVSIRQSVMTTD